ncbi:hypothetical protein BD413DRAFT_602233 [Trametes elegans]|nr:hypothetical protein BD413DRAFT_602233 [Trametes elegans]
MLAATLLSLALGASSALALPQSPPPADDRCQQIYGPSTFATYGPFTLSAVNTSYGVPRRLGAALTLSPSVSNSSAAARSLATNATYPEVEFPAFELADGSLFGVNNASTGSGAIAHNVHAGHPLSFEVSHDALDPDPVFCAAVGTSAAGGNPRYPLLALRGDLHKFALCVAYPRADSHDADADATALNVVVYKPRRRNHGVYDFDTCYGVYVQLVQEEAA